LKENIYSKERENIMEHFYDRTQRLLGQDAVETLSKKHIVILGVGGVGSWAAESLARTGIGHFTLVDFDTIEPSNINRQIHALNATVGRYKTEVMKERFAQINPNVVVKCLNEKILPDEIPDIFRDADYTIDCMDDVRAKTAVIKYHVAHHKKIVSSMGTGNKLGTKPLQITDISKTKVCPLARAVRLHLRKENIYSGVPVLYSEELPLRQPVPGQKPGTVCFVPAQAGLELAKYVVLDLLGYNYGGK
jgi:tRNA A37 threonylcarbamoyladenosine dehydratase